MDTKPDEFQYNFGGDITLVHVENYVRSQFESRFGVMINFFDFRILNTGVDPITIDYTIDILFAQSSSYIPTQQEADILIELAFLEPNKDALLQSLRTYQEFDLPFGFIDDVFYEPLFDVVVDDDLKSAIRDDEWTAAYIGMISGSIVMGAFALTVLISRHRRRMRLKDKLHYNGASVLPPNEVHFSEEDSSSGWKSQVDVSSEDHSLASADSSNSTLLTSSGNSTYDGSSYPSSSIDTQLSCSMSKGESVSIERSGVT